MNVTAAVVESPGAPFEFVDAELDSPRADEMTVRIVAAGMCHTDLSVQSAATPFPLPGVVGHEGVGVVDAIGSRVQGFEPGDRVILSFDSCGLCGACRAGRPVYCQHWLPLNLLGGSRLDGSATITRSSGELHGHFFGQSSFASHALVHSRCAIPAPGDADLELLAPLSCSVQTGVGAVLNVARPAPGSAVVIFGAGGVGLAGVLGATLAAAAQIVVVDINRSRLEMAEELGATHTINSAADDPVDAIRDLTRGIGANYTIETSGRLPVLEQAIACLASAGTCVVIGAPPLGSTLSIDVTNLLGRGLHLLGTNQGDSNPAHFIPRLVQLHQEHRLPFDKLITKFPFEQINDAAAAMKSGAAIKPVLIMPT